MEVFCQRGAAQPVCRWTATLVLLGALAASGCWAPLRSTGIPACTLPESFRTPQRIVGPPLNFSNLTVRPPTDYLLGPNDVLEVTVPDLYQGAEFRPLRLEVMANGEIHLPLVGPIRVSGMNVMQAQQAITRAYADGFLQDPTVNVALMERSTVDVLVLGEVQVPGVHPLPKYQNDVGHALAAAGGFGRDAADNIEVHRRAAPRPEIRKLPVPGLDVHEENTSDPKSIVRIPIRGLQPGSLSPEDVILHPGDVVMVPSRQHEVFFVVGRLAATNLLRFTLGDRERELGTGLILPRDREIDVVTAVTMAGYIDPILSPTTVIVHRTLPGGEPMLIHVDLIAARYDRQETILVEPGDIIYMNHDSPWYFRTIFDRIVSDLILVPYLRLIGRPAR